MPIRPALVLLACCAVALGACRAAVPSTPAEANALFERQARTVVREERFVLTSPYGETATADFADVVREEYGRVSALLGDPVDAPIHVHLVPIEAQADGAPDTALAEFRPSREGIGGAAAGESFAFLYVNARDPGPRAFLQARMLGDTIRHELTHCLARRAGLARASWFNEGLAREIESMRPDGAALREHTFPPALVSARAAARAGTLGELLAWNVTDEISPTERAARYDESQSLLRFLAARANGTDFAQRVRAVHSLPDAAVLELEGAWLDWLGKLDALSAIRTAFDHAAPAARRSCASLLPLLAERGAPELRTRDADEFALGLLADPGACDEAATFLVFFRASKVLPSDLAALRASAEPGRFLTGEALRSRRGEPFDAERARTVWDGLSAAEQASFGIPGHVLRLTGNIPR